MDLTAVKQRFGIIGNAAALNHALSTAVQVAPTDITVLITGESGVGKEVFSKILHQLSRRKHGKFIAVNCGAIPEGTIDSELFGHEKGSFTGAFEARQGYFETVNGGTIFLDELAEMPLGTQARLLRLLESGEFIKVGSSKVQKTDVRVITATNRDLARPDTKGPLSGGPVLPAQRDGDPRPAPAGAPGGHPAAGEPLQRPVFAPTTAVRLVCGGGAAGLSLAG